MKATKRQVDEKREEQFLACPRCGDLCEDAYILCFECGARLLPTEHELKQLRGM